MSFFCEVMKKTVENERMNKVVVEKREKTYTDTEGNIVGKGFETVKEISVSAEGMKRLNADTQPLAAE